MLVRTRARLYVCMAAGAGQIISLRICRAATRAEAEHFPRKMRAKLDRALLP